MTRARASVMSLGCRVNRAETEDLQRQLASLGIEVVQFGDAPLAILTTCCVTAEAQAKSRKAARRAARDPRIRHVIVWGCGARLFEDEFLMISEKVSIARTLDEVLDLAAAHALPGQLPCEELRVGSCESSPAPLRARPNLKIQDGCDHRCSYCIVWKARGPSRSLSADEVVRRVEALSSEGNAEVVLCGINLGAWRSGSLKLPELLERLLEETCVKRLRLSSIEPEDASDSLFEVIAASHGRIAEYLALPLQSGSNETLAAMGRRLGAEGYRERVQAAKERIPHVAVVADFMCGFPGESPGQWRESLDFASGLGLAKLHVFRFSPRPGTVAAGLGRRVSEHEVKARANEALELTKHLQEAYAASLVGTPQHLLVEECGRATTGGLVRALVDADLSRQAFFEATPHSLASPTTLDCRARDECV